MAAAPTESLAPAGSSTYSSSIYHVGDGTWDEGRDSFLLPNLMGLPFDVMRYNGMGNRFRDLAEYHTLILGHAVLAVIVFLFIVPLSIFIAKSYHRNGRLALKIHISLMVISTILVTVVFVLGYFAVGPVRSLSNPHHGIGLAIYILILLQAFYGWIVKCIEKGKVRDNLSVKLTLHQFLGRAIAILGFVQVALGLTLYGSPSYLFVLYALWGAFLVIVYLVLSYRHNNAVHRALLGFDDGSYVTGTSLSHGPDGRPHGHRFTGLEKAAAVVGLGAAAAALRRRMSNRHQRTESQGPILHDRPPQHMTPPGHRFEEKFTDSGLTEVHDDHHRPNWRNRLLGGAAAVGGIAAMKKMFGGRRRDDEYASDVSGYTHPPPQQQPAHHFQQQPNPSALQFQNLEEGRPMYPPGGPSEFRPDTGYHSEYQQGPPGPHGQHHMAGAQPIGQDWARPHDGRHDMRSRLSEDEYTEYDEPEKKGRFGGLFAGLGALGAAGGLRHYFRRRKERHEQEDVDDMRRHDNDDDDDAHRFGQPDTPGRQHAPYTDNSPRRPGTGAGPGISDSPFTERTDFANRPAGPSLPTMSAAGHPPPQNIPPPPVSTNMPPPPPAHRSDYSPSGSPGTPTRPGRAQRFSSQNRSNNVINEPLGGPLAATAAGGMLSPPPVIPAAASHGRPHSQDSMGVDSPPVSVKVKMHNDGRHVTVRRLSEEEAARERERHRQERYGQGSSPLQVPPQNLGPSMSPPSGLGGVASGVASSAGYDTAGSGMTDFETNRRRRRAERARLQQERERAGAGAGAGGPVRRNVEFT